jgi:hypothetical protein
LSFYKFSARLILRGSKLACLVEPYQAADRAHPVVSASEAGRRFNRPGKPLFVHLTR